MKIKKLFLAIFPIVIFSCNRLEKTPSGMPYEIIKGERKNKLKQGQIVKVNVAYTIGDSVINNTFGKIPIYFAIDSNHFSKYSFTEVILNCYEGDEIKFVLSVDTLKKLGQIPAEGLFKSGTFIDGKIKFIKIFTNAIEQEKDYYAEVEAQKNREKQSIKEYAQKNNLKPLYTKNGVGVIIEQEGEGEKVDSGKKVSVYYTGKLMDTNKEFDSNLKNGKKEPFTFNMAQGAVILGWDEGLRLFKKGGKGKLLIPAFMAYGMQGSPPVIPPYSNLIFDVEIVNIADAEPFILPGAKQLQNIPKK